MYQKKPSQKRLLKYIPLVAAGALLTGITIGACEDVVRNHILSSEAYAEGKPLVKDSKAETNFNFISESEYGKAKQETKEAPVIDTPQKSELEMQIDKYLDGNRDSLEELIKKTAGFNDYISKASLKNKLDKHLIAAVIAVESGGDPKVFSKAGAAGLMQLMPETARALGVANRTNPNSVIQASGYLADQIERYGLPLGIAAYNCGPGGVNKAIKAARKDGYQRGSVEKYLPKETQKYLTKVLAARQIAQDRFLK